MTTQIVIQSGANMHHDSVHHTPPIHSIQAEFEETVRVDIVTINIFVKKKLTQTLKGKLTKDGNTEITSTDKVWQVVISPQRQITLLKNGIVLRLAS
jgi:hypothetical protein